MKYVKAKLKNNFIFIDDVHVGPDTLILWLVGGDCI